QLPALADLLAADVDRCDPTAVAAGDPQRRRPDATTHVQDLHPAGEPGHLGDQVGVRIQRVAQALRPLAEVAEVKAVAVEAAAAVGDQIEVGADARRGPPAAHPHGQLLPDHRRQLARTTDDSDLTTSGRERPSRHLPLPRRRRRGARNTSTRPRASRTVETAPARRLSPEPVSDLLEQRCDHLFDTTPDRTGVRVQGGSWPPNRLGATPLDATAGVGFEPTAALASR